MAITERIIAYFKYFKLTIGKERIKKMIVKPYLPYKSNSEFMFPLTLVIKKVNNIKIKKRINSGCKTLSLKSFLLIKNIKIGIKTINSILGMAMNLPVIGIKNTNKANKTLYIFKNFDLKTYLEVFLA